MKTMPRNPSVEIEITDFKEDPVNGCAFAILFDVRGPGNRYRLMTVYFTDTFFERYFHIPWHKRLPEEERKLEKEKRDLFICWALVKVEQGLKDYSGEDKIIVDYETDGGWAEKVEKGLIQPQSKPAGQDHLFYYSLP